MVKPTHKIPQVWHFPHPPRPQKSLVLSAITLSTSKANSTKQAHRKAAPTQAGTATVCAQNQSSTQGGGGEHRLAALPGRRREAPFWPFWSLQKGTEPEEGAAGLELSWLTPFISDSAEENAPRGWMCRG